MTRTKTKFDFVPGVRTTRRFPVGYVSPPTEALVGGRCAAGGTAHRRSPSSTGAACGDTPEDGTWRELSYYTAVAAGAVPCRRAQCFPHLESV